MLRVEHHHLAANDLSRKLVLKLGQLPVSSTGCLSIKAAPACQGEAFGINGVCRHAEAQSEITCRLNLQCNFEHTTELGNGIAMHLREMASSPGNVQSFVLGHSSEMVV